MKISQVAKLTGVTVRTLHYYHQIGLLVPGKVTESGYRLYSQEDLELLQQILFFRELDFPLKEIQKILSDPDFDRERVLRNHRDLLICKRRHIDGLIDLVEKTIQGDADMTFKPFDKSNLAAARKAYAQEARDRWGGTEAYAEYEKKTENLSDGQKDLLGAGAGEILRQFGQNRHLDPASPEAQALVKKWQDYITANFYTCTKPILACLGQMYLDDERFTENIDRCGQGTALFMATAIEIYCQN